MEDKKNNVEITRDLGLCVSCEICRAVCPQNAIEMEYKFGQFLPKINNQKCSNCGLCKKICPGININSSYIKNSKIAEDILSGKNLKSFTVFSKDRKIRKNSTSGGVVTSLIIELIKKKEYNFAFTLNFKKFSGLQVRLKGTNDINEIFESSKSKYIPVSVYNVIKALQRKNNNKYIIVGTPCEIYGIKKFLEVENRSEEKLLFLGLFCDKTLNFNVIRYFKDNYNNKSEEISKFHFRNKDKFGWPGDVKFYFKSGKEEIIDRKERIRVKKFFQLERCLYCFDKLNKLADISFGDCYINSKKDYLGKSSVIVRTNKGLRIFKRYSYLFNIEEEDIESVRKSQKLKEKKTNIYWAKLWLREKEQFKINIKRNTKLVKKLKKYKKYIIWGQHYNINKIKTHLFFINLKIKLISMLHFFKGCTGNILRITIVLIKGLLIYFFSKNKINKNEKKNIIILGGEFFNKGSQAMVFSVVDQIKKRFKYKNIYLFSTKDFKRTIKEKELYKIEILPWDFNTKLRLISPLGRIIFKKFDSSKLENKIKKVIKDTIFFIDISGYALSTQWGLLRPIQYLLNIIVARRFLVPFYIFPQSIGPFSYPFKIVLFPLMKLYLKYPKKIFIREQHGLKWISKYTNKNIKKTYDIVLQSRKINRSNILDKKVAIKNFRLKPNSIGIIPNLMVRRYSKKNSIDFIYNSIIKKLLGNNKNIYLLIYSSNDEKICFETKQCFQDNSNVQVIPSELNSIELENVIKQFDFVIASRYHSIIQSYKNGVPAIIIGWSNKYSEIAKEFGQLNYYFDCRNKIKKSYMDNSLNKMIIEYKSEKRKIRKKISKFRNDSIFDIVFSDLKKRN